MDNPSIGLILFKDKNRVVAEYVLKDMTKPIGVSEYKLLEEISEELQGTRPSIEEIESRVLEKYKCEQNFESGLQKCKFQNALGSCQS